jgi:hypothetical protein
MVLAVLCTSVVGFLDIAMVAEVEAILVEAGEELRGKLKGAFFGLAELFVVLVALWLLLKTEHMGNPWNNESAEKSS